MLLKNLICIQNFVSQTIHVKIMGRVKKFLMVSDVFADLVLQEINVKIVSWQEKSHLILFQDHKHHFFLVVSVNDNVNTLPKWQSSYLMTKTRIKKEIAG